jgi:hypothetical protein
MKKSTQSVLVNSTNPRDFIDKVNIYLHKQGFRLVHQWYYKESWFVTRYYALIRYEPVKPVPLVINIGPVTQRDMSPEVNINLKIGPVSNK